MKWRGYSLQQKLLVLIAATTLVAAFLILLSIWGINIDKELVGRVFGTCLLLAVVAGILIAISSGMRDARKDDKDNFFN